MAIRDEFYLYKAEMGRNKYEQSFFVIEKGVQQSYLKQKPWPLIVEKQPLVLIEYSADMGLYFLSAFVTGIL